MTTKEAIARDGGLTTDIFLIKGNEGVRGRFFPRVLVGKGPRFSSCANGSWVTSASSLTKMVQSGIVGFNAVAQTYGRYCATHHRYLGLSEPVDALLHVTDNTDRRVPQTTGSCRVVSTMCTTTPQASKKPIMGGVRILVFVDDKGSELAT